MTKKSFLYHKFERAFHWCVGGVVISFTAFVLTALFLPIVWLVITEMALAGSLAIASLILRHLANEEIGL